MITLKGTKNGLSLVELILVIGILSSLVSIIFISFDPLYRLRQAREAKRWSDLALIISAIQQYRIDNQGQLPAGIDNLPRSTGTCLQGTPTGIAACGEFVVNSCLGTEFNEDLNPYLPEIPFDPRVSKDNSFGGYLVSSNSNNLITVTACNSELEEAVTITR